ncbi:galactosylgalactosylxylosylprotein 3-beta-glucuronosyltransferase 3-like [Tachypleus tridentatus]|uniref:galactosylgalactosylxylosylprotein 3-beta-glucuronosyltransferase 3-like n=1 Tax=Tachypleus tridentatus TaxID=6853 RepID=UPI003FD5F2B9
MLKTLVLCSPLIIFFFISYKALLVLEQGPKLPTIFVITPTYNRPVQQPELIRLSQTLKLVSNIHWIVVEDAPKPTERLRHLLTRTGIAYTQLATGDKQVECSGTGRPGRGITNRKVALKWLRENTKEGVVFFADDDNAYDLRLFDEIRWTKKVSVWPVGFASRTYAIGSPIVQNGIVTGFHDGFKGNKDRARKFAVDMAGFAVSIPFLFRRPNATMGCDEGYLEDQFLQSLEVSIDELEPKAENCVQVLAWHLKSGKTEIPQISNLELVNNVNSTNLPKLYDHFFNIH